MRKTRSWLFWSFFVLLALAGLVLPAGAAEGQVVVLSIEGPITPAMVNYFERGIATAEREGAQAVVIQLDTPGGQVDLTLEIVQLLRAARLPIIVYIAPRGAQAASAGAIITLAALTMTASGLILAVHLSADHTGHQHCCDEKHAQNEPVGKSEHQKQNSCAGTVHDSFAQTLHRGLDNSSSDILYTIDFSR